MIRKINKYLVENHPLIWNTRLVWMLSVLLVAHIIFYGIGFFSFHSQEQLHDSYLFWNYFSSGFIGIGILLSILIFILWLNAYFKQNALRFYYPKSNRSLFLEFIIILVISFLNISFYISYTEGLRKNVSAFATLEQIRQEADIINKAAPFTLNDLYYYSPGKRCIPAPVFDSLVSEDEVLQLYVEHQIKQGRPGWKNLNPDNYRDYKDSLTAPYYTYPQFIQLLAIHFPERLTYSSNSQKLTEKDQMIKAIEKNNINYNLNSIYNYCQTVLYSLDSIKDGKHYAAHTAFLLSGNRKDSIQSLMEAYLVLADKYGISYRFKDKQWVDYVYDPPYYFVNEDLSTVKVYDNELNNYVFKDHILHRDMETTITNLFTSKSNVISTESILILLYLALSFAVLIFTFRITGTRTWMISFVGTFILFFLFFTLSFIITLLSGYKEDNIFTNVMLGFIILFWILAAMGIMVWKKKLIAGVTLTWTLWSFPTLFPVLLFKYIFYLEQKYPFSTSSEYYYVDHPIYKWIYANAMELGFANIVVFILFVWLMIPLFKKWKAMPEE
jgi:hypothetical protein